MIIDGYADLPWVQMNLFRLTILSVSRVIISLNECGLNYHNYPLESVVGLLYNLIQYVPDPFNGIVKKGSFLTQDEIKGIKDRTFDIMGYAIKLTIIPYCGNSWLSSLITHSPQVSRGFWCDRSDFSLLLRSSWSS